MGKETDAKLFKIELNEVGDYIDISTADTDLFDRFVEGYRQIVDIAEGLPQKYKEIKQRYKQPCIEKTLEIARTNVGFSKAAIKIIDDILGESTIKKYFRSFYEEITDWIPDTECFIDFYDHMAPALEKLFERRVGENEKERIRSMGQYLSFNGQISGGNKAAPRRRKWHRKKR